MGDLWVRVGEKARAAKKREEEKWGEFREKLKDLSLSCFTFGELPALLKFLNDGPNCMREEEIEVLKKAVARSEKLLKSLPKK